MPDRKVGFGAVGLTGNRPGNLDYIPSEKCNKNDVCIVYDDGKIDFTEWIYTGVEKRKSPM